MAGYGDRMRRFAGAGGTAGRQNPGLTVFRRGDKEKEPRLSRARQRSEERTVLVRFAKGADGVCCTAGQEYECRCESACRASGRHCGRGGGSGRGEMRRLRWAQMALVTFSNSTCCLTTFALLPLRRSSPT